MGAGVDHILNLQSYANTPIVRLKDPAMRERMANYVLSQILKFQLHLSVYFRGQLKKKWIDEIDSFEPLANHQLTVGILGTGFLGTYVANYLKKINYNVIGFKKKKVNKYKAAFAVDTKKETLNDAMNGADVFIGVARGNLVTQEMVKSMAEKPIIFALSNPDPEISPVDAFACRNDLLMATGRSDYPNQVNNVLGFPYIFRGALDAKSKEINTEMKIAAVHALKDLAKLPVPDSVLQAYQIDSLCYGRDYIIPKPFDSRLIDIVPKAIFEAAVSSGVSCLT